MRRSCHFKIINDAFSCVKAKISLGNNLKWEDSKYQAVAKTDL